MNENSIRIAVLMTCHNRKLKTQQCLNALFSSKLPDATKLEVFLVDDGSTDGTGKIVSENFPDVHLIQGDGKLFWNQGMRLAWKTAARSTDYDFYLWLNDDTILDKNALSDLFEDYRLASGMSNKEVILSAACRKEEQLDEFSYGGRNKTGPVIPDGSVQPCDYINGNLVLIPGKIYAALGNLSNKFTHAMGDFDYGLRANKAGFQCYCTSKYIATCPPNPGTPGWCDPNRTLRQRWQLFHSPRGLNVYEYLFYRRTHFGYANAAVMFFKGYLKVLFPRIYNSLK